MEKRIGKSAAVFIDRDGTVIKERNYLRRVKDLSLLSGAIEALKLLKSNGYKLILVTNQSGIGPVHVLEPRVWPTQLAIQHPARTMK